jgi:hypothetical protein
MDCYRPPKPKYRLCHPGVLIDISAPDFTTRPASQSVSVQGDEIVQKAVLSKKLFTKDLKGINKNSQRDVFYSF